MIVYKWFELFRNTKCDNEADICEYSDGDSDDDN